MLPACFVESWFKKLWFDPEIPVVFGMIDVPFFFRLFLSFFVLLPPSCCLCTWRRLMGHWAHRSESKTCKQTSTYVVPLIFLLFPHPWSGVQHPILCKNPFCVWSYEELGDRIYNLSRLLAFCIWLSCFYLLKKLWLKCNHSMGSILWFVSRSQCRRAMFWWRVCEKLLPLLESSGMQVWCICESACTKFTSSWLIKCVCLWGTWGAS